MARHHCHCPVLIYVVCVLCTVHCKLYIVFVYLVVYSAHTVHSKLQCTKLQSIMARHHHHCPSMLFVLYIIYWCTKYTCAMLVYYISQKTTSTAHLVCSSVLHDMQRRGHPVCGALSSKGKCSVIWCNKPLLMCSVVHCIALKNTYILQSYLENLECMFGQKATAPRKLSRASIIKKATG